MRNARSRVNIDRPNAFGGFNTRRLRSVARYGDRPCANVFRRLKVAIVLVAALLAAEVQALPVRCRDVTAGTAPTACVTRTDRLQLNPDCRRLVFNFESHIGVRPSVDFGTEVFPLTQRTVSNVREFFHNNASCADFNSVADQCLGCDMQKMSRYGSLMPGHPSQESSGRLGANRLNSSAGAPNARTTVIQHPAVEEKCFGIGRVGGHQHALDAHIHTNDAAIGLRFGNLDFVSQAEKPLVSYTLDLRVFPRAFRQWARIGNSEKLTPKCDAFLGAVEVPLPHRRDNGTGKLSKPPALVRLGGLIGGADGFAEGAGKLGRQPHLSEVGVVSFRQSVRVQFLGLEDYTGKPVCGFQPSSKQLIGFCAAGNLDLDYANCFHYIECYHQEKTMSTELRRKGRVSTQKFR